MPPLVCFGGSATGLSATNAVGRAPAGDSTIMRLRLTNSEKKAMLCRAAWSVLAFTGPQPLPCVSTATCPAIRAKQSELRRLARRRPRAPRRTDDLVGSRIIIFATSLPLVLPTPAIAASLPRTPLSRLRVSGRVHRCACRVVCRELHGATRTSASVQGRRESRGCGPSPTCR
jgi:hypothetical protein